MIMIRGQCYAAVRLYELYKINTEVKNITDGIMLMVENNGDTLCILQTRL